ncbi:MAG: TlpA family protein disulfide reductase [Bacteroidales bacterium]|nr:TlpA family protein disulfide reductase [Bacteroidales bacterium]
MKKFLTAAAALCIVLFSITVSSAQTNKPKEGDMFRNFTVVQDASDPSSKVSLSDYVGQGKWVVADFWASWCHWCIKEIPYLQKIYRELPADKVTVLSIAVWDKPADTKAAAAKYGVVWAQIINTGDIASDVYKFGGIPYTVVFNPQGKIAAIGLRGENLYKFIKLAAGQQ